MSLVSQMLTQSPKKVTLKGYSDASLKSRVSVKIGSRYHSDITLPINPEGLSSTYLRGVTRIDTVSTEQSLASGSPKKEGIFQAASPERTLNTSFILDDTLPGPLFQLSVQDSIEIIEGLCTARNSSSDTPVWLKLQWGAIEYTGLVSHLSIDQQMFNRGGAPVRARVSLGMSNATVAAAATPGSGLDIPSVPVLESTTLTALLALVAGAAGVAAGLALTQTDTPYANDNEYLNVAEENELDSLNDLPVGDSLIISS